MPNNLQFPLIVRGCFELIKGASDGLVMVTAKKLNNCRTYCSFNLFNAGGNIRFECDNGFDLIGAKNFVCQNGKWQPQSFPTCVR